MAKGRLVFMRKTSIPSRKNGRCSGWKSSNAVRFTCDGSASTWPKSGSRVAVRLKLEPSPTLRSAPALTEDCRSRPGPSLPSAGRDVGRHLEAADARRRRHVEVVEVRDHPAQAVVARRPVRRLAVGRAVAVEVDPPDQLGGSGPSGGRRKASWEKGMRTSTVHPRASTWAAALPDGVPGRVVVDVVAPQAVDLDAARVDAEGEAGAAVVAAVDLDERPVGDRLVVPPRERRADARRLGIVVGQPDVERLVVDQHAGLGAQRGGGGGARRGLRRSRWRRGPAAQTGSSSRPSITGGAPVRRSAARLRRPSSAGSQSLVGQVSGLRRPRAWTPRASGTTAGSHPIASSSGLLVSAGVGRSAGKGVRPRGDFLRIATDRWDDERCSRDDQGRQEPGTDDDDELVRLMTAYQAGELAAFERLYALLAGELAPLLLGGGGEGEDGARPGAGHLPRDPPLAPHLPAAAAGAPVGVRHRAQRPRPPPAGGVAAGAPRGRAASAGRREPPRRRRPPRSSSATSRRPWRASPPRRREAWVLHHVHGWSFQQIADRFRIGVGRRQAALEPGDAGAARGAGRRARNRDGGRRKMAERAAPTEIPSELLAEVARGLRPVRPLASPARRMLALLPLGVALLVAVPAFWGWRSNFSSLGFGARLGALLAADARRPADRRRGAARGGPRPRALGRAAVATVGAAAALFVGLTLVTERVVPGRRPARRLGALRLGVLLDGGGLRRAGPGRGGMARRPRAADPAGGRRRDLRPGGGADGGRRGAPLLLGLRARPRPRRPRRRHPLLLVGIGAGAATVVERLKARRAEKQQGA